MNTDEDCIFCAIVAGDAPSHPVIGTEHTLAFLDINPVTRGHTLVVPKRHADDLWDVDGEDVARVMRTAWEVAAMARDQLGADGINLFHATRAVAWQEVDHFHVHVLPRYASDGLSPPPWDREWGADHADLADVARRLGASRSRS